MSARDKLIIETPEQIALEFPLAGAGSRFLAVAIDTGLQIGAVLVAVLLALVLMRTAGIAATGASTWIAALFLLGGFALHYGYFAAFETLWNGQTPGKRVIGLRVVTVTGRPLTPVETILRNLLRIVDQVPGIYAVGVLAIFLTARNQRLGDLAAGTVVVHEQAIDPPDLPPPVRTTSARYGAARLTADERALVEAFLQRRAALDSYVRLQTARQVLARVRARLEVPAETPDEERLLEEIVEEYRRS